MSDLTLTASIFPEEDGRSWVNCGRKWLPVSVGRLFTGEGLSAVVEAAVQMKVCCQQGTFKYEPANLQEAILATLPVNYREKPCVICNHQHIRSVTESARDYLRFNLNSFWG